MVEVKRYPIGAIAGWLFGKMWRWHVAGRIMVLTLGPLALGLITLGLARPELFPTTVLKPGETLKSTTIHKFSTDASQMP